MPKYNGVWRFRQATGDDAWRAAVVQGPGQGAEVARESPPEVIRAQSTDACVDARTHMHARTRTHAHERVVQK